MKEFGERSIAALTKVMPWLHPKDLASLACTCSALAVASASLTSLRADDLSRGLERFTVPVINTVDHLRYPLFSYSPSSILRKPSPLFPWGFPSQTSCKPSSPKAFGGRAPSSSAEDCPCCLSSYPPSHVSASSCITHEPHLCTDAESPPLLKRPRPMAPLCGHLLEGELAYDSNSRLYCLSNVSKSEEHSASHGFLSIMECGPACGCSLTCKYRVTQRGLSVKVAVHRDHLKGWSLRAMQFIPKGAFTFEYAGELLTTPEAQSRQKWYDELRRIQKNCVSSLLVVREHLPSGSLCLRLNIDATHVGNVARFVNHSCDGGNLQPCLTRLSGSLIPKLVFFARCDIAEGEELTFSYGDVHDGPETHRCFCKTPLCRGYLPFEET